MLTLATVVLCKFHFYDNVMGRQVIFQVSQVSILIFYSAHVETKLSSFFLKAPTKAFLSSSSFTSLIFSLATPFPCSTLTSMHCTLSYHLQNAPYYCQYLYQKCSLLTHLGYVFPLSSELVEILALKPHSGAECTNMHFLS